RPGLHDAVAMTFDTIRARAVLLGDTQNTGVFEWDGLSWSRHSPAISPAPRNYFTLAFDGNRSILFGGQRPGGDLNDLWGWDGLAWTELASGGPLPRAYPGMSWDSARHRLVLFG